MNLNRILFILLFLIVSCSAARIRRLNPDGFLKTTDREYDIYHSKKGLANLEIYFSEGEKENLGNATLKARIVNGSDSDLVINLKDTYQWSAWYRWKRRPKITSADTVVLKSMEEKEINWVWNRREFGVMIVPFNVGDIEDEFQVKFENCSPWGKCETEYLK